MARSQGRLALVTGGARGLGAAACDALAAQGATIVIADIIDEPGQAKADQMLANGSPAEFIHLDVTDPANWAAVIDHIRARHGRLDCLVNNAGISVPATIEDATLEQFRRIVDINLFGAFIGMQAAIPLMKLTGGSIINIASNSTQMVLALTCMYGPTKAALANLTKSVAAHCARRGYGIRVNSIHPGPHETQMLLGEGGSADADIPAVRAFIDAIPMARMGRPAEVGSVVAFLASDDASYMTGSELFVDGGLTMSPLG